MFVTSTIPTSASTTAGCSQRDATHAPLAFGVVSSPLLHNAASVGLANPAALTRTRGGAIYVSSPTTGVIAQLSASGAFVRRVLAPTDEGALRTRPFATGTPVGLAVAPDGVLYYADAGLERRGTAIVAGVRAGTIRRIAFEGDRPLPPEVVRSGLQDPEGIGIWTPPA
jgi:hypothetical protein